MSNDLGVYTLKKVQITCPQCKHEFPYNKASLDKKIAWVGKRINEYNKLISSLSKIPEEKLNKEEFKRLNKEKERLQDMLVDLKLTRETLKAEEDRNVFNNFKEVVKEFFGKDEYFRCLDEALRRSASYNTENIMGIDYYSSATGKPIRKV